MVGNELGIFNPFTKENTVYCPLTKLVNCFRGIRYHSVYRDLVSANFHEFKFLNNIYQFSKDIEECEYLVIDLFDYHCDDLYKFSDSQKKAFYRIYIVALLKLRNVRKKPTYIFSRIDKEQSIQRLIDRGGLNEDSPLAELIDNKNTLWVYGTVDERVIYGKEEYFGRSSFFVPVGSNIS